MFGIILAFHTALLTPTNVGFGHEKSFVRREQRLNWSLVGEALLPAAGIPVVLGDKVRLKPITDPSTFRGQVIAYCSKQERFALFFKRKVTRDFLTDVTLTKPFDIAAELTSASLTEQLVLSPTAERFLVAPFDGTLQGRRLEMPGANQFLEEKARERCSSEGMRFERAVPRRKPLPSSFSILVTVCSPALKTSATLCPF
jgi:hypothetical protein